MAGQTPASKVKLQLPKVPDAKEAPPKMDPTRYEAAPDTTSAHAKDTTAREKTNREEGDGEGALKKDQHKAKAEGEGAGKKDHHKTKAEGEGAGKKDQHKAKHDGAAAPPMKKKKSNREKSQGKNEKECDKTKTIQKGQTTPTKGHGKKHCKEGEHEAKNKCPPSPSVPMTPTTAGIDPIRFLTKNILDDLCAINALAEEKCKPKVDDIQLILDKIKELMMNTDMLVRVAAPVKVVGDIHGQFHDLKVIFRLNGLPPKTKYLFLGDYVDRGPHSFETIMILFCYKLLYNDSVILLRGNHECMNINRVYGFYEDLIRRGLGQLYPEFNDVFDHMPFSAVINNKILCMHGGISTHIKTLNDINALKRPVSMMPPDSTPLGFDLLWADPDKTRKGYFKSSRGISNSFGLDVLEEFCLAHKLDCVVRGHQCVQSGFERLGLPGGKTRIVTVFSAPNYCNEMDNNGAIMLITEKLGIHFNVLETEKAAPGDKPEHPANDKFPDLTEGQNKSMHSISKSYKMNAKGKF